MCFSLLSLFLWPEMSVLQRCDFGLVGVLGDQGTILVKMGKHSWGHTALVGLRLNGLLHTFISVFAQGMCPNLHTLISVRGLHRSPTGWDESDPVMRHRLANSSMANLECSSFL